eukprot:2932296-Rhodomonas_salina.1
MSSVHQCSVVCRWGVLRAALLVALHVVAILCCTALVKSRFCTDEHMPWELVHSCDKLADTYLEHESTLDGARIGTAGSLTTVYNNDERCFDAYFAKFGPEWYCTGDAGYVDADGYVHVMSRTDDVINVAGHRLSSGQIE